MTILWNAFTPGSALAGGVLIGLAAALMVLLLGRIAGISGMVGELLRGTVWRQPRAWGWRLAFVLGLCAAPLLWQLWSPLPPVEMPRNPLVIVAAGLLVGFGTRLGSGCTSGHGVCGLSRLSLRSLAATVMFMATGALTVFFMRHWLN